MAAQQARRLPTKYIGKEFEETDKGAKKYWHSRNVQRPQVERFWLKAKTFAEAVAEAHDLVYFTGATSLSMWGDDRAGVIWITGETAREWIGRVKLCIVNAYGDRYNSRP